MAAHSNTARTILGFIRAFLGRRLPFLDECERINDIYNDSDYLRKVVKMGAERARESASKTVREVREIIGYKPF